MHQAGTNQDIGNGTGTDPLEPLKQKFLQSLEFMANEAKSMRLVDVLDLDEVIIPDGVRAYVGSFEDGDRRFVAAIWYPLKDGPFYGIPIPARSETGQANCHKAESPHP